MSTLAESKVLLKMETNSYDGREDKLLKHGRTSIILSIKADCSALAIEVRLIESPAVIVNCSTADCAFLRKS